MLTLQVEHKSNRLVPEQKECGKCPHENYYNLKEQRMSLTTFIAEPDVKAWFKANFPFHAPKLHPLACSEPRTKRYAMVGTAFDYLPRFKLQQMYPYAVTERWVAEYLTSQVEIAVELAEAFDMLPGLNLDLDTIKNVWQAIQQARANHATY
jgi:hypothetical protein